MSTKFATPADLITDHDENFSRIKGVDQRQAIVQERAISIYENGQVEDVRCFLGTDGKPHVYIGHTRTAAVALLNQGFSVPTGEEEEVEVEDANGITIKTKQPILKTYHLPDLKVRYVLDDLDTEKAAVQGVVSNWARDNPTDMDLAYTADRFKKVFGWTNTKITETLKISDPNKVSSVVKLLTLPQTVKDAIHEGNLATSAGLELTKATGDVRKAIVKDIEAGKFPTAGKIKKAVEGPKAPGANSNAWTGRDIKEVYDEFVSTESADGEDDNLPEGYRNSLGLFLRYLRGSIKPDTFFNKLLESYGMTPEQERKGNAKKREAAAAE